MATAFPVLVRVAYLFSPQKWHLGIQEHIFSYEQVSRDGQQPEHTSSLAFVLGHTLWCSGFLRALRSGDHHGVLGTESCSPHARQAPSPVLLLWPLTCFFSYCFSVVW